METEVKEHEERSHSARYLVLIFLVLVAMCGVFFSAGFIVGRNEGGLHSAPPTEVVNTPGMIPPTVNLPPDTLQQDPGTGHAAPDNEVVTPPGAETNPSAAPAKPAAAAPAPPAPAEARPVPATPAGKPGITLQVLAMHTRQDADSVVTVLKEKGYPAFLLTPENAHADDSLYRVLVGPFKTREDADMTRAKLKQDGFKPFIRH